MRLILALLIVAVFTISVQPAPLPVVRYANYKVYDPVYVAFDKGFFAARGVRVVMIGDVLGGPPAIAAVSGRSADAALAAIPSLINARAAGLPVVGVSDIQSSLPTQPLEEFFVRADSPIRTIADTRGKTWAVNNLRASFHYTALLALEQVGVPEDSVRFVLLFFPEQIIALDRGSLDIISLIEPYATYANRNYVGKFRRLFTALDIFGSKQFTLHFFNARFAAQNPEAVRRWVSAVVDAMNWIHGHQEEAKQIVGKYTGIAPGDVPTYRFQRDGRVVMEDCRWWLDYLRRRGDVKAPIKAEDVCTNEFNVRLVKP